MKRSRCFSDYQVAYALWQADGPATPTVAPAPPPRQTLADFDFAFQSAIERSRIETKVDVASMRDTGWRLTARLPKDDSPQAGTPRTARAVTCADHIGASGLEVYMLGQ